MRIQEIITISTQQQQRLRGRYASFSAQSPLVIFAHGLGSTRNGEKAHALELECEKRVWAFAAFDFHGHGESVGTMQDLRGSRLLEDLKAITDWATTRGHQTIFLVGSSMGGWAASWFSALHVGRITACAFIAPAFRFLEFKRLTELERETWRQMGSLEVVNQWIDLALDYGLHAEAETYPFDLLVERFHTPSLIFHGMQDDTVSYHLSLEFAKRCTATEIQLWLINNGDHRLNAHKEMLARASCDFFAGWISP
ncbi:MAG: alpha/beta fold hydrolase [Acidobacteria bacterium]|nr:alpha/beta fold hydrolase [Acidobacteriota bacterium]